MSDWEQVSQKRPCEVCGKPDWCQFTDTAIQCMRQDEHPELGIGVEKTDSSGNVFWTWSLGGRQFDSSFEPTVEISEKRGDDETLHRVYSAFLNEQSLHFRHIQDLAKRGLTIEEINDLKKRGYRSQLNEGRAATVRRMLKNGISESDIAQTPGFYIVEHEGSRYWTTSRLIGMLIPVRNSSGQIVSLKVRLDDPDHSGKYKTFSSSGKKRNGSSPGSPVHFPAFDYVDTSIVRVTEGQLKADVATLKTGILTIGLAGVGGWRAAVDAVQSVEAETAIIAYDADHRINPNVRRSLLSLVQILQESGLFVRMEIWK